MNRRTFLRGAAAAAVGVRAMSAPGQQKGGRMKVLLWCWDARMTWDDEPGNIATKMAAAEQAFPYSKRPEAYLTGFRRLVDYCAETGIWGVIVWGFLRDGHGGVVTAQDLCKYARDKGVAILPGVGLCAYGGYYFEGDHAFNLNTYLRGHPDRASTACEEGSGREVHPVLDPALPANQAWWREGLEWMLDTFEVGGVDFEMGDFMVNPSARAQAARKALGFDTNDNVEDTVVATQGLMKRALELMPDGVFVNSTYRGYQQVQDFPSMPYVDAMAPEVVWQYTLRRMVTRPAFPKEFMGAPSHRQYGYLHWFNASTGTMEKDYTAEIARVFPGLQKLGFDFAGTYGEVSAVDNPLADANYRAQVAAAE
ncbi:MAG: hypothetical protein ACLFTT_01855 [Candidatus Hydrogenedentota bacterium]